jgi:hypothetical protein
MKVQAPIGQASHHRRRHRKLTNMAATFTGLMADYGWGHERANYGEYSGAPSTEETFVYAKILLSLIMRYKRPFRSSKIAAAARP